ncbi:MAG: FAD-binding protein [Chitinophagaceae bacterium]|nr:FAD-binding protein [Chitinophagaceae bacterium]
MENQLAQLENDFDGLLFFNGTAIHQAQLLAYSTDASVYQEKPLAVAIPATIADIQKLIRFANQQKVTLIPRAAGTSLAGQVVGNGIVVDISKYFTRIIEVNAKEKWVRVQPGVIRDELNHYLRSFGLMFGPETSTASRAMIGGMLGNNSCGLHSIVWGSVRDHVREVKALLSDGSEVVFGTEDILPKQETSSLKEKIYSDLYRLLSDRVNQDLIRNNFPKSTVHRRNTGYALDSMLAMQPFKEDGETFNICKLLAGSEGTLAFITEIKLGLIDLPPKETAVVCIHCHSIIESLRANIVALQHDPMASELVDKYIMDFTIHHPEYSKNRFFIEGDPAALLMVEFMDDDAGRVQQKAKQLIEALEKEGLGYAYPVLYNEQTKFAWDVRKAGLGLLRNLKGDTQPVNLIEDCAVSTDELPDYIADLQKVLEKHKVNASYYAHAGAGEVHVEPMVNLKSEEGLKTFRNILSDTVELIKKYKGSLSGEHGDGRLRGEYISTVIGEETYRLFQQVKNIFDPHNIFNAGKITATPAMDTHLRLQQKPIKKNIKTTFDFSGEDGILRLAEKCSGSGDCRKMPISGGTMCPSYMATRLEKDTTRARANLLRQFLSNEVDDQPFNHKEIKEIMDLCLSCKGCKTECPSGVDVAKMKAEFLQQYYDKNGIPFRARLIANFSRQMKLVSKFPGLFNWFYSVDLFRKIAHTLVGFHPERSMPKLAKQTLLNWFRKRNVDAATSKRKLYLFCDEFTNYNDVEIGKKGILLLEALGYEVIIPKHIESGRTYLSKGLVKKAAGIANQNIQLLADLVMKEAPLIGIEPSAILTFRDEYIDLAAEENYQRAKELAANSFTIEEFLTMQAEAGMIDRSLFTTASSKILIHGHCYHKSLSSQKFISSCLEIPANYKTSLIPSGCCGMAGGFGYEKEHFTVSQQVGELVLFPAVRAAGVDEIIVASGTSCRHQVKDGTGKKAFHPVEVLYDALIK